MQYPNSLPFNAAKVKTRAKENDHSTYHLLYLTVHKVRQEVLGPSTYNETSDGNLCSKVRNNQDHHGLCKNQLLDNVFTRTLAFRFKMNGKIVRNFDALFSSGLLFNADIAFDSRKVRINTSSIQSKISCSLRRRRSSVLTDDKNARRKKKWEIIVRLPVKAPEESDSRKGAVLSCALQV